MRFQEIIFLAVKWYLFLFTQTQGSIKESWKTSCFFNIMFNCDKATGMLPERWNLFVTSCSLLVTFRSLLQLLFTRCSLFFGRYSLLFPRCLLRFTRCSTRNFEGFFWVKVKKQFPILICTKNLICDNLKTTIVLNWRLSAIVMGTKDKIP